MATENASLPLPPATRTEAGDERRVGVEIEFAGLSVDRVAEIVARHIHGDLRPVSEYEIYVDGDPAGEWEAELDFAYLKNRAREQGAPDDSLLGAVGEAAESVLRAGAELLVPVEVVSPPLPLSKLAGMEPLIRALRQAGARGTGDHFAYAFGMHLNPEMPALDSRTVTRYIKAYACLYDWLVVRSSLDAMRRLTPYIEPFKPAYTALLVNPSYQPDVDQLIDDYLEHNPTRNRALDMLPLFAHLDEERVRATVDDPRIKARPTLHYRLPNCEIERADWDFSHAWLDWLQVEHLASDGDRLNQVCRSYTDFLTSPDPSAETPWSQQVEQWLVACDDL